jgi:hypothetical protein
VETGSAGDVPSIDEEAGSAGDVPSIDENLQKIGVVDPGYADNC